eukprot:6639006-Pyramimonas_sp.AAC.1
MQASKAADTYGLFDGQSIEQADARHAYIQSKLGGAPTWVFLPREEWPESWPRMRNPGGIRSSIAKGMSRPTALSSVARCVAAILTLS